MSRAVPNDNSEQKTRLVTEGRVVDGEVMQGTRGRDEKEARPQTQWEWVVRISGDRAEGKGTGRGEKLQNPLC